MQCRKTVTGILGLPFPDFILIHFASRLGKILEYRHFEMHCHLMNILLLAVQPMSFVCFNLNRFNIKDVTSNNIEKAGKEPLLKVREPYTQCNVHLIGVSHGSPVSATLVKDTVLKLKPSTIVLELCDERYLAICVENNIKPRNNDTMLDLYIRKQEIQAARDTSQPRTVSLLAAVPLYFNFVREQGVIIGSFVAMGLVVGGLQRLMRRSSQMGDEFVTAMQSAEYLNIPIKLGDAQQSATLRSVQDVVSIDTIRPSTVLQAAKLFAFSAFGLLLDDAFPTATHASSSASDLPTANDELHDALAVSKSQWLSIPAVYAENNMLGSLLPLVIIYGLTVLLGYLGDNDISGAVATTAAAGPGKELAVHFQSVVNILTTPILSTMHAIVTPWQKLAFCMIPSVAISNTLLAQFQPLLDITAPIAQNAVNVLNQNPSTSAKLFADIAADVFSALLLVRLTKIIGSDRDRIIASKIQNACKDYPGTEVVVVLGMLHCNGVARWLLSGRDPLTNE